MFGSVRLRASLLFFTAVQFVVLTTIAMLVYGDRYDFFGHFLSELGATRTPAGRANHPAMVLFSIAVACLGLAFVGFAAAWRSFTCTRTIVKVAGVTAQTFGSLSGLAFVAVAFTPVDVALDLHNALVVSAFGFLLGYVVTMTIVWACNGAPRTFLVATCAYLVCVLAYFAVVALALDTGIGTSRGLALMVVSQKCFAYVSMLLVVYVALATRRYLTK